MSLHDPDGAAVTIPASVSLSPNSFPSLWLRESSAYG